MKNVLFLTVHMRQGFGVPVEIHNLSLRLTGAGVRVKTGCLESDGTFKDLNVEVISADKKDVLLLAESMAPCVIVAHASPFFEILPQLADKFECWAWENGDPTPCLFGADQAQRQAIVDYKRNNVYQNVSKVIAISDFIKHDIGVKDARIISCGCDHVSVFPPKQRSDLGAASNGVVKIGTLMRLGYGESCYKGNEALVNLASMLKREQLLVEVHAAGQGTSRDTRPFIDKGIIPHLNLSEEEKYKYLRGLDIFVSLSQWEGFNLPLVEAQAMGTLSLCLDTGAHPEVCPFVLNSERDVVSYVRRAVESPEWLIAKSRLCCDFVRRKFSWDNAVKAMLELL